MNSVLASRLSVLMFLFVEYFLIVGSQTLQAEEEIDSKEKIEFYGDFLSYIVYWDNPYFQSDKELNSYYVEPTFRLGTNIHPSDKVDFKLRGSLCAVAGDSKNLTGAKNEIEPVLDLWNVEFKELLDKPLSIKIGRQEIGIGDGFVIWDGVSESAAVSSTPLRSFYAGRVTYSPQYFNLDLIAALTEHDFIVYDSFLQGYRGRSGLLGGNIHIENEIIGNWDFGIYFRDDTSDLGNDTNAISLKGEYAIPHIPILTLSGEAVKQYGTTKMSHGTLSASTHDRNAWGGHIDATFSFKETKFAPYIKGSFRYLSGDDPDTSDVEAYDRMFTGCVDWSKWRIGIINATELLSTNVKMSLIEGGISPTDTTKLRVQLMDFSLDEEIIIDGGKKWSKEVGIILDWFPSKKRFYGVQVGYANPQKAAKSFNQDDQNTTEVVAWVGFSF